METSPFLNSSGASVASSKRHSSGFRRSASGKPFRQEEAKEEVPPEKEEVPEALHGYVYKRICKLHLFLAAF